MKRILLSLITIGIVSAGVFGATKAFFTDTEKSVGNTFSAGTIDIAVNGNNPWSATQLYQFQDMKPSQTEYANFVIKNVGNNPANVWKKVGNVVTNEGVMTEPECAEYGGTWVGDGDHCSGGWEGHDIHNYIDYDLSVKLYNPSEQLIWWQMIYNKNVTVAAINGENIFLGMIPEGWHMDVVQSYHMKGDTGNWAQGDTMTFDITLTAEQLRGSLTLENKNPDPIAGGEEEWLILGGDIMKGTLSYSVKEKTFNYTFNATGLSASTAYSLIHYVDPWPGNGSGVVGLLGSGTTDGSGVLALSGNSDLNANMINAKIWLVPSSDYDVGNRKMVGWNPGSYLFETGLIDYYDADLP